MRSSSELVEHSRLHNCLVDSRRDTSPVTWGSTAVYFNSLTCDCTFLLLLLISKEKQKEKQKTIVNDPMWFEVMPQWKKVRTVAPLKGRSTVKYFTWQHFWDAERSGVEKRTPNASRKNANRVTSMCPPPPPTNTNTRFVLHPLISSPLSSSL